MILLMMNNGLFALKVGSLVRGENNNKIILKEQFVFTQQHFSITIYCYIL